MDKLPRRLGANGDLTPWEAELGQRLASLKDLPTPPSLAPEATEQFLQRLRVQPIRATVAARRPAPIMRIGLRFAAMLIACLLGVSGVSYATATSLPGDPLYGLKRQVETVQLAVSPADQQPGLAETLVDRRLDEVAQLIGQHASEAQVDAGVAEYAAATVAFGHTSTTFDKESLFQRHLAVLARLESDAPAQNRTALQAAQRAAQTQLVNTERNAPQPTVEPPRVRPTQVLVNATPSVSPSATTAPVAPTASSPPIEQPTSLVAPPAAAPPTAPAEVRPSATPPAATAAPQKPEREPTARPSAAPAKPAPARRASPQPTREPAPPQPSDAPSKTEQPGDARDQAPATTPERPSDAPGQGPAPTPERPDDPRDGAAPPSGATAAPRSEQPSAVPGQTNEPAPQHDPPSAPPPDKTQAPEPKPGSGGSQQPPPGSGDPHPRPPSQPGQP